MPYGAHGTDITAVVSAVDYAAKGGSYPLGHEVVLPAKSSGTRVDAGEQIWIYVYNDEAATDFVIGNVVAFDAGTARFHGILAPGSANSRRVIGVAQHTIPFGGAGFILKRGFGEVLAGNETIDVDECIYPSIATSGAAMEESVAVNAAPAAGVAVYFPIGWATENAAAAALATCYINCNS